MPAYLSLGQGMLAGLPGPFMTLPISYIILKLERANSNRKGRSLRGSPALRVTIMVIEGAKYAERTFASTPRYVVYVEGQHATKGLMAVPCYSGYYICLENLLPPMFQIRNMAEKVGRKMWSTPTDAMDLVASLNGTPGCYVKWDLDGSGRLNNIFWSTADQRLVAQQYGHLVIQDNTCLTNK